MIWTTTYFVYSSKKFELVQFRRGSIEIVPHTWKIDETTCYYPTSFKDEKQRRARVAACVEPKPKSSFKKHKVAVLHVSGKFCRYLPGKCPLCYEISENLFVLPNPFALPPLPPVLHPYLFLTVRHKTTNLHHGSSTYHL